MKQITETQLYTLYLDDGWEDIMSFPDFEARCELAGIDVVKEEGTDIDLQKL